MLLTCGMWQSKANTLLLPISCWLAHIYNLYILLCSCFLLFLCFCLFEDMAMLSYSFRACLHSHLSSALLIFPCTDSITNSHSLTQRGLLKECCWGNGMMVLVIWKLPAVCVFHYWQWCSRRIYGSGQDLVNFFLLIRCHLCTNEAIKSALYAVVSTFVGSGVLNGHLFVVILMFQNLQKHSCTLKARKLHHGSLLSHFRNVW